MVDQDPALVLLGPPRHGVVQYAGDVAREVARQRPGAHISSTTHGDAAVRAAARFDRVHLHVTDRILGRTPEEAADLIEEIASVTRLSITVHDVPQLSDGATLSRRTQAYARFIAVSEGIVVSSHHERALMIEHLGPSAEHVAVIPMGSRIAAARGERRHRPADRAGGALVALISGFVYPGKGHREAIHSVSDVAGRVTAAGEPPESATVVAIGAASKGHEQDVEVLRAEATALGVQLRVTGYLDDTEFMRAITGEGIPLAAHRHVSASRSMLDWVEQGRRPLVVSSRYAREMAALRPGTMTVYEPEDLPIHLEHAWRHPESTRLPPGTSLAPTLADTAAAYIAWWSE